MLIRTIRPFNGYFTEFRNFKLLIISLLCLSINLSSVNFAQATHSAGAELSYRCLGGLDYEITATFYRDCNGITEPASVMINYVSNSCGYVRTITAYKDTTGGEDITFPCAGSTTTCEGGSLSGIARWEYKAVVTLPAACYDWKFSFRVCCRNCSITTILDPCQAGSELYVEATLDNINAPCNSSPSFTNNPIAFVCVGQNFNYNPGISDVDGDSIFVEFIDPKTGPNNSVSWIAPSSKNSPISSSTPFTLDPETGHMNFTPDQFQIGVITTRICEYRNGLLVGTTIRDMQVYTQFCNNTIPSLTGINGTQNFSASYCAGSQICFDVLSSDADTMQNVSITANSNIPGAVISISPGTRPVATFCWTPQLSQARTRPYSFTLTVRDDACPSNSVQIFNYSIRVVNGSVSAQATDVTCYGSNDGTVSVSAPPGSTVKWNTVPPSNSKTITNLPAGTYVVNVDLGGGGCVITETVVIYEPSPVSPLLTLAATPCGATCAGTAIATAGSGVNNSYLWNTGSTTQNVTGLCDGVYTVTVTDSMGCSGVVSQTLTSTGAMVVTDSITDLKCAGGSTGSIVLNVSGGTPPYSYKWAGSTGVNSIHNLTAGSYQVEITDANNCVYTATYQVSGPNSTLIAYMKNVSHVSCKGLNDGYATIFASGGTQPYSYQWSNGTKVPTSSGLTAGIYSITVSDANGCRAYSSIQITEPQLPLQAQVSQITDVNCYGGNDGTIDISISGGTTPYDVYWSNGASTQNIQSVPAGLHKAIIKDTNGCTDTLMASVSQPTDAVSGKINIIRTVQCFGDKNGALYTVGVGGTKPYSYQWSTGSTLSSINNLDPGSYPVTITDSKGCNVILNGVIDGPVIPLTVSVTVENADCFRAKPGKVDLFPFGGTPGYQCLWDNGTTSLHTNSVTTGAYQVVVSDLNGCTTEVDVQVNNETQLNIDGTPAKICEGNLATLEVDSFPRAFYQWYYNGNIINGTNSHRYQTPAAGYYTVRISSNNCGSLQSDTMRVTVNTVKNASISSTQIICPPGGAKLFASGGVGYSWSPNNNINFSTVPNPVVNPLTTTVYSVVITDVNGCTKSLTVPIIVSCDSLLIPTGFSPNSDGINDGYVIKDIDKFPGNKFWVYNSFGSLIYSATNYDNKWDGRANTSVTVKARRVPQGTYFYILDLADGSKPRSGYIIIKR
jgi:gliding motility-associated-like protein